MSANNIYANRTQLRRARQELVSIRDQEREALRFNGIGPGDSYVGMWRMVNWYRRHLTALEGRMGKKQKQGVRALAAMKADKHYLAERICGLYAKLLNHEMPRLQSIEFKGDPSNPVHTQADLRGLSDADLQALARILPKLGGANGQQPDQGEAGGGPRGGTAPAPADRSRRRA